ncbi:MAG: hypothetical protein EOP85_14420 [Verrucomicrobiaceae bacterium]|nr:MAG: hypothetical protein EOP85_14420 [Verrucomicrobiaceae bacterium]
MSKLKLELRTREWTQAVVLVAGQLSRVACAIVASLVLSSCGSVMDPGPAPQVQVVQKQSPLPYPVASRNISGITFRYVGAMTVDEARLRKLIHLREGGVYSRRAVDESVKDLYESGLVDDVVFKVGEDGGKLQVTVVVQTRPGMGLQVHIIGNSIFPDQTLSNRSMGCCPQGKLMSRDCLEQACRRIEEFYRRQGYPATRVEIPSGHPWVRVDPQDPDSYEACVLMIEEGAWTMAGQEFSAGRTRRGR